MTVKRLRFHPLARIKFPDGQKMQQFVEMISIREPTISNIIKFMDGLGLDTEGTPKVRVVLYRELAYVRFMDGLGLATEMTDERIEQNAYYCGYDCDTMVNTVLIFGPDGKVFFCAINYPGSWSDGTLTTRFLVT